MLLSTKVADELDLSKAFRGEVIDLRRSLVVADNPPGVPAHVETISPPVGQVS